MRTGMSSTRAVFWSLDGLFPHLFAATGFSNWDMCTMHVHDRTLLVLIMHHLTSSTGEFKLGMKNRRTSGNEMQSWCTEEKAWRWLWRLVSPVIKTWPLPAERDLTVTVTMPANTCRQCLLSPHWHGRWRPGSGIACSILCLPCSNAACMGMRTSGLQKHHPAPSSCSAAWTIANSLHLSYPSQYFWCLLLAVQYKPSSKSKLLPGRYLCWNFGFEVQRVRPW